MSTFEEAEAESELQSRFRRQHPRSTMPAAIRTTSRQMAAILAWAAGWCVIATLFLFVIGLKP